ncbi:phosphoribosylaminoimidazole carboxylase [Melia azedarach]|uniref:Phosphoribosylaminoimidazole carboxylase n=1 Tax=Melia azedarach TaxID=155640 RepID=A0ACC1Y7K3_MELAZ|nr:phosphoribosylaminoimidazole carboxylase [Melia azedarach]
MDSDTDLPVMKDAMEILSESSLPYEVSTISAHQTPAKMYSYASNAEERGIRVIIAGMIASLTRLPVIGVPLHASALNGMDSLLSMVQMPRGVPVATVAVDNAASAGFLAGRILGLDNLELLARSDPPSLIMNVNNEPGYGLNNSKEVTERRRLNALLLNASSMKYDSHFCLLSAVSPRVEIIMESDSDLPIMKEAARVLIDFGVPHEVAFLVTSTSLCLSQHCMVASLTPLPVIGVPVRTSTLDGIDSLVSITQMRGNVPVATVAINNSANAALLAVRMWGLVDAGLRARMRQYQEDMRDDDLRKAEKLNKVGWESYLNH